MKAYKIGLLIKEFPWLSKIEVKGGVEFVDRIRIEVGGRKLLGKKGYEKSYSWSGGGTCDYTIHFAVVDEEIIPLDFAGDSSDGSGNHREWDAETLGEQLFRRKLKPDFILECNIEDSDANGNGRVFVSWIIYKMRNFNLASYHKKQIDMAAAEIKAEIDRVCA